MKKKMVCILLAGTMMFLPCELANRAVYAEELPVENTVSEEEGTIEFTSYLENYKDLVEKLEMEPTDCWQFGDTSDSYVKDQFYLEWEKDSNIFSAKNEGASSVKLCGTSLGDNLAKVDEVLQKNEWFNYYNDENINSYMALINDKKYALNVYKDQAGNVSSWYLNNWPEGDNVGDIFERIRAEKQYALEEGTQTDPITAYPEYDEIIRLYQKGEKLHWSTEEFREHDLCYLAGYEMNVEQKQTGYYVTDIDGDGVDELMVGVPFEEGIYDGMFYGLYTMINDQRVLVATSGERDRYYLCQDHTIANEGSSGAALSVYSYYDFLSGKLQLKECVFTDGNDHPENPWFYSTSNPYEDYSNPISEEEARNVMNKYVYETIPYTFLDDYNAQNDTGETTTSSYRESAEELVNKTEQEASFAKDGEEEYEIWDNCLNEIWSYLQTALSAEEMDTLTQEEMDWIQNKESTISSMQMQSQEEAAVTAAALTKQRVYELIERL